MFAHSCKKISSFGRRFASTHVTQSLFDYVCKYPTLAKPVSSESISLLSHPRLSGNVVAGGNAIIGYDKSISSFSSIEKVLDEWADIGTIGCIHEIKDGKFAGKKVAIVCHHTVKDCVEFYAWNGNRTLIGHGPEDIIQTNVWQSVKFEDVIARDEVNDLAVIAVADGYDNQLICDYVHALGYVAVDPQMVGKELVFAPNDAWIGSGFISDVQPLRFNAPERRLADNVVLLPAVKGTGFVGGDSCAPEVKVIADERAVPPLVAFHTGRDPSPYPRMYLHYSAPISVAQKLCGYPTVTEILYDTSAKTDTTDSGAGGKMDALKDATRILDNAKLKVRGIPQHLLPEGSVLLPPVDMGPQEKDTLRIKGIPSNFVPSSSVIIPPTRESNKLIDHLKKQSESPTQQ